MNPATLSANPAAMPTNIGAMPNIGAIAADSRANPGNAGAIPADTRPSSAGTVAAGASALAGGAVAVAAGVFFAPSNFRTPLAIGGGVAAVLLTVAVALAAHYRQRVRSARQEALAATVLAEAQLATAMSATQARIVQSEANIHGIREQLVEQARAAKESETRRAAAMAAFAGAAGRMQAMSTSMLAELREMEHRHADPKVLADLLELDHRTAQAGRLADSIAVLSGARSGRRWAKPIAMESILRGAMGRVAGYPRVRLRAVTEIAIAGHAAEGIMHALAELLDNACNFSPPTTEVHVYAAAVPAGVVIPIEDSGLVMSESALRRAESAVSRRDADSDLSSLSGTRLGLAVVGHLARKHDLTVSYRPSAIGGTAVVVVVPRELITRLERPSGTLSRLSPANTGSSPIVLPGHSETTSDRPEFGMDQSGGGTNRPDFGANRPGAAADGPGTAASPLDTVAPGSRPTPAVDLPASASLDESPRTAPTSGGLPKRRRSVTLAAVHPEGLSSPTTAPPRPASPPSSMAAFQRAVSGRENPVAAAPSTSSEDAPTPAPLTDLGAAPLVPGDLPTPDDEGTGLLPSSIIDALRRDDRRRERLGGAVLSARLEGLSTEPEGHSAEDGREYSTGTFSNPATPWETDR